MAENIRTNLYYEAYAQKRRDDIAAQLQGVSTLEEAAEKLGLQISNLTDVTFSTNSAPTTEPSFIGAVFATPENKLGGPVAGNMGTYLFRVNGRETGSFYTEDDAQNLQNQYNSYGLQLLLPVMMDKTVKDNRARFF